MENEQKNNEEKKDEVPFPKVGCIILILLVIVAAVIAISNLAEGIPWMWNAGGKYWFYFIGIPLIIIILMCFIDTKQKRD